MKPLILDHTKFKEKQGSGYPGGVCLGKGRVTEEVEMSILQKYMSIRKLRPLSTDYMVLFVYIHVVEWPNF